MIEIDNQINRKHSYYHSKCFQSVHRQVCSTEPFNVIKYSPISFCPQKIASTMKNTFRRKILQHYILLVPLLLNSQYNWGGRKGECNPNAITAIQLLFIFIINILADKSKNTNWTKNKIIQIGTRALGAMDSTFPIFQFSFKWKNNQENILEKHSLPPRWSPAPHSPFAVSRVLKGNNHPEDWDN